MLCCVKQKESPTKDTKKDSQENLVAASNNNKKPPSKEKQKSSPVHVNKAFDDNVKPKEKSGPQSGKDKSASRDASPDQVVIEGFQSQEEFDPKMATELAGLLNRLEVVTSRLESVASKGGGGAPAAPGAPEQLAAFVGAYDDIIKGSFAQFVTLSGKIGGDVKTQVDMVEAAFKAQRDFMRKVSLCKQPSQQQLMGVLQPTSQKISAVQDFRERNRSSQQFNHLSTISESIPSLGWVTVAPTPGPYVKEMSDAGQFYGNRVIKDFKEKDKTHVEWVRAWTATLTELQAYIKQYHTTGISWNAQGADVSSVGAPSGAPPPPGPPPPPCPPPPVLLDAPAPSGDQGDPRSALFADLNKGADITKGLKKVSDDQKTHKNPALRQGPQPFKASPTSSQKSFKPFNAKQEAPQKPPKFELDGKKWLVEYQKGNRDIVITETNQKQGVYIFRCQDSTVQVKGKVNAITLDGCKKTAVVFESAISSLEMINCQSIQAQVNGKVPTISIDKTDGCQVYLSKDSIKAEIITAKSSEMNILVPDKSGEFKEYALPEQYKTIWSGKKFVTEPSDINS